MSTWPPKDPDEVLDYKLDWANPDDPRLETGETIITSAFTVPDGDVVVNSDSNDGTRYTTVWLSGGTDGTVSTILNRITTSAGRTYDKSVTLRIRSH